MGADENTRTFLFRTAHIYNTNKAHGLTYEQKKLANIDVRLALIHIDFYYFSIIFIFIDYNYSSF